MAQSPPDSIPDEQVAPAGTQLLQETTRLGRAAVFSSYGRRPSYSFKERGMRWLLRLLAFLTVGVTFAILGVLLVDAVPFFQKVPPGDFFFGTRWEPFGQPKRLGVLPLLSGTLMIALGACAIATPLGLGTAVFLSEYAGKRTREIIGPMVEVLGGIPTVVYGYFALTSVTPALKTIWPRIETFNALSGSIVVGIATLPMISALSTEALRLVPSGVRQAAYAVGMRKFHVVVKVLIPAAFSGIVSSLLLGFSRAVGETMAVTLAAGATPNMEFDYLRGIQTITAFIVQVSLGDTPTGSIEYYTIYALGLTLFVVTFLFNFAAVRIVRRFQEIYQ